MLVNSNTWSLKKMMMGIHVKVTQAYRDTSFRKAPVDVHSLDAIMGWLLMMIDENIKWQ